MAYDEQSYERQRLVAQSSSCDNRIPQYNHAFCGCQCGCACGPGKEDKSASNVNDGSTRSVEGKSELSRSATRTEALDVPDWRFQTPAFARSDGDLSWGGPASGPDRAIKTDYGYIVIRGREFQHSQDYEPSEVMLDDASTDAGSMVNEPASSAYQSMASSTVMSEACGTPALRGVGFWYKEPGPGFYFNRPPLRLTSEDYPRRTPRFAAKYDWLFVDEDYTFPAEKDP